MLIRLAVHRVRVVRRTEGRLDQNTASRHAFKLKMVSLDGLSLQGLTQMSMSLPGTECMHMCVGVGLQCELSTEYELVHMGCDHD